MHSIRYPRGLNRNWLFMLLLAAMISSCQKKEINFGDDPENNYTRLIYTDTVGVQHSTVVTDSFATNNLSTMLLGKYSDPFLGTVDARNFFRLNTINSSADIPASAVFDSLTFIIRLNHYYYGDTTSTQTISVHELSETITLSYADRLYNTTNVNIKPTALGSRTLRIKPVKDDSVIIRLDNVKGQELFTRIKQRSDDVMNLTSFQNYFKGIRLSVGPNDLTAIYGIKMSDSMVMRLHYHHTTPVFESKHLDFTAETATYAFNQVTPDRSGTGLPSSVVGVKEIPSSQTGGVSYTQDGTGLLLKMTFPGLRNLLSNDDVVRLLKAELIVRPLQLSYDDNRYKLPGQLYLAATNGSNIIGNILADSSGADLYAKPMIDFTHGENTHYRFNVTGYINELLTTPGTSDYGFFLMEDLSSSIRHVDRAVINNSGQARYRTQLLLNLIIINK
jgi:hypothetical protein